MYATIPEDAEAKPKNHQPELAYDVTRNGIKMSNGNSAPGADTSRAARKRYAGIT